MSEELTRLQQEIFGNMNTKAEVHESKPIRAGVASLLSMPSNIILGLPGLASAGVKTMFNDKSFAENAANTSLLKASNAISDTVHAVFGATRPEEQDRAEKWGSFAGDAVPLIASKGTYGLLKAPQVAANVLTKSASKTARKTFRDVATKQMNKFATKDLRLSALHEANVGKGSLYNQFLKSGVQDSTHTFVPSKGVARTAAESIANRKTRGFEYLLPGYQVSKTQNLVQKYLKPGVNSAEDILKATKHAHITQGIELGAQLGIDLALEEGLAAYNDQEGLIGDYRDTLDHKLRQETSSHYLPAALGVVGLIAGYGAMRRFGQMKNTQYDDLVKQQRLKDFNYRIENTDIKSSPYIINHTNKQAATNYYNYTAFADDPAYEHLFTPLDKANLRYDTRTSINATLNYGYPNVDGPNIKPTELHKNLTDLYTYHPEQWKIVEDYIDVNDKIASITDTINRHSFGKDAFSKYEATDLIAKRAPITELDQKLKALVEQSTQLRKQIDVEPTLRKIVDDIQLDSKIRLRNAVKSGRMTQNVADYLERNRTINGYFSYKPFHEQMDDLNLWQKTKNFLTKQGIVDSSTQNMLGRVDRDIDKQAMSFTDTYLPTVMSELLQFQHNTRTKAVIMNGLKNQFNFLKDLDKNITDINAVLSDLEKRLTEKSSPLFKEKVRIKRDELKRQTQRATNLTHIEYIGTKKAEDMGKVTPASTPYAILNQETKPDLPSITNINKKRHTKDIETIISNAKSSNNIISFKDSAGNEHFFEVAPLLKHALDFSPEIPDAFQMAMLRMKQLKTSTTTGRFNPMFALTSLVYGFQEGVAAIPRWLNGKLSFKEMIDYAKYNGQAIKMQMVRDMKQEIVNNWKEEMIRTMGDMSQSPMAKKLTADQIAKLENDIEDCLLTRFEKAGAVTYRYPNGLNGTQYPLSIDLNLSEKLKNKLVNIHGARKGIQCFRFIGYCTDAMRNASTIGALLHINAKKVLQNSEEMRLAADTVSRFITDSKKSGIHVGAVGSLFGKIGTYTPYGRIGINSIATKLAATNVGDAVTFLKAAKNQIKYSKNTVADTINMVKLGASGVLGNQYLQALYMSAFIPATVCYLWNNMNQDNREDYYKLSDFDKSSKLILANFYGKGNHLTVPLDQEIGVGCKLYETMLDSVLNLSKDNGIDPAFQQSRLIGKAMARSLNIEDMVLPEAMLNLAGYKTNLEFGGSDSEGFISKLPQNVTNLDGSQTALQDGVFTQEATALMNTIFGSVGSALTRGIEQAHINTRDVGVGSGLAEFVKNTGKLVTKPVPFAPNDKMTFRSMNQTAREVKAKIDTIDKLRKLNTFNSTDPSMVGKNGNKVAIDSMQRSLDPSLQFASQVAQVAVPYYNQNIRPIYDQISGIYKQIAAYNASGRDSSGNAIGSVDRWKYQQNKNEQIQKIYKQLYFEFDKLENLLTTQFRSDINLSEFNNLQGV